MSDMAGKCLTNCIPAIDPVGAGASRHPRHKATTPKVASVDHGTQMPAHLGIEPDESQLADQKLQTRIRCHALGTELDGDIAVDTALNICFHSSHST